ncbi:hypothetical protein PDJ90_20585 [Bacillus cereus]|nr:hypothetical protein [Bacillus cereus]
MGVVTAALGLSLIMLGEWF